MGTRSQQKKHQCPEEAARPTCPKEEKVLAKEAVLFRDGYGATDEIHLPARVRPTVGSLGSIGGGSIRGY